MDTDGHYDEVIGGLCVLLIACPSYLCLADIN